MIITRTPFRFTLGGGGTDLPNYYSRHRGFIFAAGIDKYMFIDINRPIVDDLIRIKYSRTEIVEKRSQVKHEIARAAMQMMNIEKAIEIVSMADVPAGTGLGSSSCYSVGLLNALHTLKREYIPLTDLAEEAYHLEVNILRKPIGKQDQYLAAYGGLTVLEINKSGKVAVRKARVTDTIIDDLNRNLLMFYTKTSRNANTILAKQSQALKKDDKKVTDSLHHIKDIGYQILEAAESGNLTNIGLLFDRHWRHKKKISRMISNERFDEIYDRAKSNGALGGKITGAGGGGFFLFYVEKNHSKLRNAMRSMGLIEMRYHFDFEGTKTIVNFMDRSR